MSLREYVRKRKLGVTPEPAPQDATRRRSKQPIFVVQLHHASRRHYDFRLEVDGALKSWAVPKGPSLRPGDKRLAVEVEDHPLSYATFAGDIPKGHYGAGHVDIFDHGVWTPDDEPLRALAKGHLDFQLHGDRLRGHWTLVRTHLRGDKPQWLLIKRTDAEARDADADDLLGEKAASPAKAGTARKPARRNAGKASTAGSVARAKRPARAPAGKRRTGAAAARWRKEALALAGARDQPLPAGFRPQLCTLHAVPPRGDGWLHETKWDGYRLLADLDAHRVRLRSRNDLDWSEKFPEIAAAIEALPVASARFDGEMIALDTRGRSDFSVLQHVLTSGASAHLRYAIFDLPALAGVDLRAVALVERKALLERLLAAAGTDVLSYSTHIIGHGDAVYEAARKEGLEGIVSKRADAPYVEERTHTWLKIKHALSDEFIVVGYSAPKGSRSGFGALLLATVDNGALRYVGRVGSGFGDAQLAALKRRLDALAQDEATVALPAHVPFRASTVKWVRPQLVIEVAFRGWAKEGLLRQASFLRLREDKGIEDLGMRTGSSTAGPPKAASRSGRKGRAAAPSADADVVITHPDRVVFPGTKYTKQDVADYYRAVAGWMLPELVNRPLSIVRCPDGAGGTCFFQKHHAATLGANVASIPLKEKGGASDHYLYLTDLRGVLELVQMNVLEFHPWGARVDAPDQPDRLVFDLDPAPGIEWKALVAAARDVRERLRETGLESFVRLSGGKGVHVVVPLRRGAGWEEAKSFCSAFAVAMATQKPLTYLATASKAKRSGRIFIDWLRNARGSTSVASWSLRAREGAPVAMPLQWEELARARSGAAFDLAAALRRATKLQDDPWHGFLQLDQPLPSLAD